MSGEADTLKLRTRAEAFEMALKLFDRAVKLFRAQATGPAERAVAAAADAMCLANALHQNPLNNASDQFGRWSASYVKAHGLVAKIAHDRKVGR